jgi:hypothetical protein
MIFHPAILALYVSSLLGAFLISYSSYFGVQILRRWDIRSGSETQLLLERKTYLISTILTYIFAFQLVSLFLFIFTVDRLHSLFVGAMCAAGTLKVNEFGYSTLILKIGIFLLAGVWLILNHADNQGYDYPLIKKKYLILLILAPFVLAEMVLQAVYFLQLQPNIITSCCGSLFSAGNRGFTAELASLPAGGMMILFYASMSVTGAAAVYFYRKGKGGYVFSILSGMNFLVSLAAIISFISLYYYELPTHHCPFCILQKEYGYIGYPLYLSLFGGVVAGIGAGILPAFRNVKSLSLVLPSLQKKLTLVALVCFLAFAALVTCRMVFSDFTLSG